MRKRPILFSLRTDARRRRVYAVAIVYFVAAFIAMVWPVYPLFSRIRPLVLGLPLSLFYLVTVLSVSFFVLLGLYLWEAIQGLLDADDERPATDDERPATGAAPNRTGAIGDPPDGDGGQEG